jgi:hypothetical protein
MAGRGVVENGIVYEILIDGSRKAIGQLEELVNKQKDVKAAVDKVTGANTKNAAATEKQATAYKKASTSAGLFNKHLLVMAKRVISIYALARAFKFVTDAVIEQEKATATLNASLKNTGVYSDNFSKSLQENAAALQKLTIYGDEAILTGTAFMQNIGKLGQDVLPAAQKAALGLAAAYDMDLQTAFMLVGRAAAGQTQMLTRYGIVLSEGSSQQQKFNELLALGASNFALAEAQADTLAGRLAQMKNMLGDTAEVVGDALLPAFKGLLEQFLPIVDLVGAELAPLFGELVELLEPITDVLLDLIKTILPPLIRLIQAVMPALNPLIDSLAVIVELVGELVGGIVSLLTPAISWLAEGIAILLTPLTALTGQLERNSVLALEAADATKTLSESIKDIQKEASVEAEKFKIAADRLLYLRKQESLAVGEKREMKRLIGDINRDYGDLIGNINLETAAYDKLTVAATNAANALINKQVAAGLEGLASGKATQLARARVYLSKLEDTDPESLVNYAQSLSGGGIKIFPEGIRKAFSAELEKTRKLITDLEKDLTAINDERDRVLAGIPEFVAPPGGGGGGGAGVSIAEAVYEVDKALSDFWDTLSKYSSANAAADPVRGLADAFNEYLTLLGKINDETLALTDSDRVLAQQTLDESYLNNIYNAAVGLQDSLTAYVDSATTDRIALIQRETQQQITALDATRQQVLFLIEAAEAAFGAENAAAQPLIDSLKEMLVMLNLTQTQIEDNSAAETSAIYWEKAAGYADMMVSNVRQLGLTYDEYSLQRKVQIEAEIRGLEQLYGMTADLARLQEMRMASVRQEWESIQLDSWIEQNQLQYELIENTVDIVTEGFATMIREGKSFGETMNDIWQNWVDMAIAEVQRLIAKLVVAFIIKQLIHAAETATGTGGIATIASMGTQAASDTFLDTAIDGWGKGFSGNNPIGNSAITPGGSNTLNQVVHELQALRRDVYAAQPDKIKMDFRKGDLSYAVDNDRKYRAVMA